LPKDRKPGGYEGGTIHLRMDDARPTAGTACTEIALSELVLACEATGKPSKT